MKYLLFLMTFFLTTTTYSANWKDLANGFLKVKASCTYRLTAEGVGKPKVFMIKSTASTKNQACAEAKIKCQKQGRDKGFFGRHRCDRLNADGTLLEKLSENSRIQNENKRLKMENARLKNELKDRAATNSDVEVIDLRDKLGRCERTLDRLLKE